MDQRARFLRPAGGGIHTVSTGKQVREQLQRAFYDARDAEEVQVKWRKALEAIDRARVAVIGIPSDCGAGLARGGERITTEHLPALIADAPGRVRSSPGRRASRPPPKAMELEELMRRFKGNMLRVARELDRKPALVYRWAKRFHLNADDFRPKDDDE